MNYEEYESHLVDHAKKGLVKALMKITVVFMTLTALSPIVWIWFGWSLFWKTFLTLLFLTIVTSWVWKCLHDTAVKAAKKIAKKSWGNKYGDKKPTQSKFQSRIDELMKKAREEQAERMNKK